MKRRKFHEGQRVKLLENRQEGWPEEFGVVEELESRGMLVVRVSPMLNDDDPDGLREVHENDVEAR